MKPKDIKEGCTYRVSFTFTSKDLETALEWARDCHFTYEGDGEIARLLIDAARSYVFEPVFKDSKIEEVE